MSGARRDVSPATLNPAVRCYLFYGPDEAGSRALASRTQTAIGVDAERIDIAPARLAGDPALLADEAASPSLFGGTRYIRVDGVGEESLAAIEGLLAAPVGGDPVILVGGALRKESGLVKFLGKQQSALVRVSYLPDAEAFIRIAEASAAACGLTIDEDVARLLVDASGNDRAVLASEIAKLADYLDAAIDRPRSASAAMLEAIAGRPQAQDSGEIVTALFSGDVRGLELGMSDVGPADAIPLARAIQRRLLAMAACRAEMDRGAAPRAAVDRAGRALFWRDKDNVARDLPRWSARRLAIAIDRLASLERSLKSSSGAGPIAAHQLYQALARSARR